MQYQLREPLRRAHDVCRVDGLVGRDQDERLDAGLDGRFGRVPGADDVVVNAFDDVVLDDRDMFVRSRVIDGLHAERSQHFAHAMAVMRVPEQGNKLHRQVLAGCELIELALDGVQGQLRHLEQHQAAGRQPHDLPA